MVRSDARIQQLGDELVAGRRLERPIERKTAGTERWTTEEELIDALGLQHRDLLYTSDVSSEWKVEGKSTNWGEQSSKPLLLIQETPQIIPGAGRACYLLQTTHSLHSPLNEPWHSSTARTKPPSQAFAATRPHDHRHVSRQPCPRLLAFAKRISRPPRPHIDPPYPSPPLGRTLAPEARFLLPGQARRPITSRLLLPSRPPR